MVMEILEGAEPILLLCDKNKHKLWDVDEILI